MCKRVLIANNVKEIGQKIKLLEVSRRSDRLIYGVNCKKKPSNIIWYKRIHISTGELHIFYIECALTFLRQH